MSLIDDYFKGWNQGQAAYDGLIQGRQAQAANRIKLDGAQMQLENDAILREARLNQALEELRNSASQHEQQRRFRTGLDGLTYQGEQARLGAETWKNLNDITAGREAADTAGDTWGLRRQTASNNARRDNIMSNTGITSATTENLVEGQRGQAVSNNAAAIRSRFNFNLQADANRAGNDLVTTQAEGDRASAGVIDAKAGLRNTYDREARAAITREALTSGATSPDAYQAFLQKIVNSQDEPEAKRYAAGGLLAVIQEEKAATGNRATDITKVQMAVTAPEKVLEENGLKVLGADPKTGLYPVSDGLGGFRMMTHAQMQYQAALLQGLDPKNFQTAANAGEAAIVKAATGDTTLAGIIGAPQTGYYIAPPNTPTPEQQAQTVAINKTIMQATGWMPSMNAASRWMNPQTGEAVPEADVAVAQQAAKEKLGIQ